jgi:hypothetical protein
MIAVQTPDRKPLSPRPRSRGRAARAGLTASRGTLLQDLRSRSRNTWYPPNAASAPPAIMSHMGLPVPRSENRPLAPRPIATRPNPMFQYPAFMHSSLHRKPMMRWLLPLMFVVSACAPSLPQENWTCDFDASETRPLADPDASADGGDGGALAPAECQATCGPPASSCTLTYLDGGEPAAVCPVCTF